jgi:TetR/AcrR family transcriptional regulator of autoinduction and epiphytic fitness
MEAVEANPRSARSERTRASIADALLSLLEEGELQPTATRIAERAGISLRLIYHHFGDLEALFRETSQREMKRVLARVKPVSADLPLAERIDAFVEQRCRLLEWLTPVRRAAGLHEPFSPTLSDARDAGTRLAAREFAGLFARELEALPADQRRTVEDAVAMATGWEAWNGLRVGGRSEDAARRAVHLSVTRLLSPA